MRSNLSQNKFLRAEHTCERHALLKYKEFDFSPEANIFTISITMEKWKNSLLGIQYIKIKKYLLQINLHIY